jgi:hypothetical protein
MDLTEKPISVITNDFTKIGREKALCESPYGRCVHRSDNNVVDHQVVNIEFENKVTASFTMSAFTDGNRRTRIMGTMVEMVGNFETISLSNFKDQINKIVWVNKTEDVMGHGGGDFGLMKQFILAVKTNDPTIFGSSIETSLESHLMAFAAEKSRLTKKIIEI